MRHAPCASAPGVAGCQGQRTAAKSRSTLLGEEPEDSALWVMATTPSPWFEWPTRRPMSAVSPDLGFATAVRLEHERVAVDAAALHHRHRRRARDDEQSEVRRDLHSRLVEALDELRGDGVPALVRLTFASAPSNSAIT